MNPLEKAAATSPWAALAPGEKAVLLGGLLWGAVALPPWPGLLLIGVCLGVIIAHARVPLRLLAALVIAPAAFLIPGCVPLVLTFSTHGIRWVDGGWINATTLLCRCAVATTATMVWTLTTPLTQQLFWARKLHIPEFVVQLTMLTYRMVGTLWHTAVTMNAAQAQRLGHTTWRATRRSLGRQGASLYALAFIRARALDEGLSYRADTQCLTQPPRSCHTAAARPRYLLASCLLLVAITAITIATQQ